MSQVTLFNQVIWLALNGTVGSFACDSNLSCNFCINCDGSMQITRIQFDTADLIGYLPTEIGLLGQLRELTLQGRVDTQFGLVGTIPLEIQMLSAITDLSLAFNRFTSMLAFPPLVERVFLQLNSLSELPPVPPTLRTILAFRNQIQQFPTFESMASSNLTIMNLNQNLISGTISALPANIVHCRLGGNFIEKFELVELPTYLRTFEVSNNNLTSLPPPNGLLKNLLVSHNRITGTLPHNVGHQNTWDHYEIQNNLFTGDVGLLSEHFTWGTDALCTVLNTTIASESNCFTCNGAIPAVCRSNETLDPCAGWQYTCGTETTVSTWSTTTSSETVTASSSSPSQTGITTTTTVYNAENSGNGDSAIIGADQAEIAFIVIACATNTKYIVALCIAIAVLLFLFHRHKSPIRKSSARSPLRGSSRMSRGSYGSKRSSATVRHSAIVGSRPAVAFLSQPPQPAQHPTVPGQIYVAAPSSSHQYGPAPTSTMQRSRYINMPQ